MVAEEACCGTAQLDMMRGRVPRSICKCARRSVAVVRHCPGWQRAGGRDRTGPRSFSWLVQQGPNDIQHGVTEINFTYISLLPLPLVCFYVISSRTVNGIIVSTSTFSFERLSALPLAFPV